MPRRNTVKRNGLLVLVKEERCSSWWYVAWPTLSMNKSSVSPVNLSLILQTRIDNIRDRCGLGLVSPSNIPQQPTDPGPSLLTILTLLCLSCCCVSLLRWSLKCPALSVCLDVCGAASSPGTHAHEALPPTESPH